MMNLLPKTMLWYDRVSSLYKKSCEEIIGQKLSLGGLRIQVITRIWPKNDVPDQSLYKHDKNRINPASRLFTKQPDIDRAMSLVKEAKIEVCKAVILNYHLNLQFYFSKFLDLSPRDVIDLIMWNIFFVFFSCLPAENNNKYSIFDC